MCTSTARVLVRIRLRLACRLHVAMWRDAAWHAAVTIVLIIPKASAPPQGSTCVRAQRTEKKQK